MTWWWPTPLVGTSPYRGMHKVANSKLPTAKIKQKNTQQKDEISIFEGPLAANG